VELLDLMTVCVIRQILFNVTVMIRSYFGLCKDIGAMYVAVAKDNLLKGFALIDELALSQTERILPARSGTSFKAAAKGGTLARKYL
jgi:hypothetical protein